MKLPSGFAEKIALSFIDKVILGAMVGLLIWHFQAEQQRQTRLKDQAVALSSVSTDLLIDGRKNLVKSMTNYIAIIEQLSGNGADDARFVRPLRDLRFEIQSTLFHLGVMNKALEKEAGLLLGKISDTEGINHLVASRRMTLVRKDKELAELRNVYARYLKTLSDQTRETILVNYGVAQ